MKIRRNISLKNFTTFRIGGKANYFVEAKNDKEIKEALGFALDKDIPFFILGGGSNILVSDNGFQGIVIRLKGKKIKKDKGVISVFSGTPLSSLVSFFHKESFSGLEEMIGIPGTVGGAVRGNAGAFENYIGKIVFKVKVWKIKNKKILPREFSRKECHFSYRESIFKKNKGLIIREVVFVAKKDKKEKIEERMKKYFLYRRKHQPLEFPSAGSIFKNYQGVIKDKKILKEFPEVKEFNERKLIPAGFLIDKLGLKGLKKGRVMVSKKHANFIINLGGGKAKDVLWLIDIIKRKVREKFKIKLEEEIEFLGDFS